MTLRKVAEAGDHPILKIKLGIGPVPNKSRRSPQFARATAACSASMQTKAGTSIRRCGFCTNSSATRSSCANSRVPAGHPEQLRAVRERVSIPIVADEDALVASDLPRLIGCVDGVNVKLAKTGGIRGALAMIHTARAMGLKIMIGCMVESAIASTAAAQISPLADWADIDGPFLVARDPFAGVTYRQGKLVLPDAPGLGVREGAFRRERGATRFSRPTDSQPTRRRRTA